MVVCLCYNYFFSIRKRNSLMPNQLFGGGDGLLSEAAQRQPEQQDDPPRPQEIREDKSETSGGWAEEAGKVKNKGRKWEVKECQRREAKGSEAWGTWDQRVETGAEGRREQNQRRSEPRSIFPPAALWANRGFFFCPICYLPRSVCFLTTTFGFLTAQTWKTVWSSPELVSYGHQE